MFLIKFSEDIDLLHEYEVSLIYCVSDMNRIFVENTPLPSLCLGCLGVQYLDKKINAGEIEHISKMIEQGYGKCDSIVAWFMTLYTLEGKESRPIIVPTNRPGVDHVQLQVREGNIWKTIDPSINLNQLNRQNCRECSRRRP